MSHLRTLVLPLTLCFCGLLSPMLAQNSAPIATPPTPQASPAIQPATITGTVTDSDGAAIAAAKLTLTHLDNPSTPTQQTTSNTKGAFTFTNAVPGSFQISIEASGFSSRLVPGSLLPGQQEELPPITLRPAVDIGVVVTATQREVADAQIKEAEQQRILGAIPNFYVSYNSHPVPLDSKQKFALAWKTNIDPVTFILTGAIAGINQAQVLFPEYGHGAQAYGKYYGAAYADGFTDTMIGGAILPSLLKQDPRYFYKGTGTIRSRALYAIGNVFICKGDNGKWQPNYSGILGGMAGAGISNLYYPPSARGAAITFESIFVDMGEAAATNLLQEFLIRKLTPRAHNNPSPQP